MTATNSGAGVPAMNNGLPAQPTRQPLWRRLRPSQVRAEQRDRRTDVRIQDSGGLVAAADVLSLSVIAMYEAFGSDSILGPVLPESTGLARLGVGLIAFRVVVMLFMSQVHRRIWGWFILAAGSGELTSEQKGVERNRRADELDENSRKAFENRSIAYWGGVSAGLFGYWVLVSITGGPFTSPLAPLMLANFFLAQVRSTTKLNIGILFFGGVAAIVSSWLVADAMVDFWFVDVVSPGPYSGGSYIPAALVVAIFTTLVNLVTIPVEPSGTLQAAANTEKKLSDPDELQVSE